MNLAHFFKNRGLPLQRKREVAFQSSDQLKMPDFT